jgi:hypothetical protein
MPISGSGSSGSGSERRQHVVAVVLALSLLVGAVAVRLSLAAFSDATSSDANTFSTGSVVLSDDDAGSAMFGVSNMRPADTVTQCLVVTYSGSLDANVELYGAVTAGTGLENYLDLTVERGSGGTFADCAGFVSAETVYAGTLAGFVTAHSGYATGAGTWAPTGGAPDDAMTYRFVVTLQDDNNAQALSTTASLTWEAQNV